MSGPVLTVGEAMVSFRSAGPIAAGRHMTPGLAGAETNVAIGLARLGHPVQWVGRVGGDAFGSLVLRELAAEGVLTEHAVVETEAPTGLMFVEERTADVCRVEYRRARSAGSLLDDRQALTALEATAPAWVHITGITPSLSASAHSAVRRLTETAADAGIPVSLDVNHRARLWTRDAARAALAPLIRHLRLLVASQDELGVVAGEDEQEGVAALRAGGVAEVAVKRGPAGASLWTEAGRVDLPAVPVTPVDPLGAGDAFTAGLISGHLDGLGPPERLARAVTLGAWAVATRGDWQGLPVRSELDHLVRRGDEPTTR